MVTRRKVKTYWTETKRVVRDASGEPVVKQTCCCCKASGASRKECITASGNKTPCRCWCHSLKLE